MDQEKREKTLSLMPIGSIDMQDEGGPCLLQIDQPFRAGLQGLENFSHVIVFWWADGMDNNDHRKFMITELPYAKGVDVGVFACRAEYRPNPIAITTVPILAVNHEKGEVIIKDLTKRDKGINSSEGDYVDFEEVD